MSGFVFPILLLLVTSITWCYRSNNVSDFIPSSNSSEIIWGWKFLATPEPTEQKVEILYKKHSKEIRQRLEELNKIWDSSMDNELLAYTATYFQETGNHCADLQPQEFSIPAEERHRYPLLQNLPEQVIQTRFSILRYSNRVLQSQSR